MDQDPVVTEIRFGQGPLCSPKSLVIHSQMLQQRSYKIVEGLSTRGQYIFFSEQYKEIITGSENIIQVDFLDFGGHIILLTTHPTFMSDRSLYFLVFDCSMGLQGEVRDPDINIGVNTIKSVMGKQIALFLLSLWYT